MKTLLLFFKTQSSVVSSSTVPIRMLPSKFSLHMYIIVLFITLLLKKSTVSKLYNCIVTQEILKYQYHIFLRNYYFPKCSFLHPYFYRSLLTSSQPEVAIHSSLRHLLVLFNSACVLNVPYIYFCKDFIFLGRERD